MSLLLRGFQIDCWNSRSATFLVINIIEYVFCFYVFYLQFCCRTRKLQLLLFTQLPAIFCEQGRGTAQGMARLIIPNWVRDPTEGVSCCVININMFKTWICLCDLYLLYCNVYLRHLAVWSTFLEHGYMFVWLNVIRVAMYMLLISLCDQYFQSMDMFVWLNITGVEMYMLDIIVWSIFSEHLICTCDQYRLYCNVYIWHPRCDQYF